MINQVAAGPSRELPEKGNYARYFWPLLVGGLVYGSAAARAQTKWAPLAFAAVGAYAVNKAMVNERDYINVSFFGGRDLLPF